jgi:predicted RND superfamily exporter protein
MFPPVFTPLCKLFYLLQRKPAWLFAAALAATALALIPLRHFEVRASATDLLPRDWESVKAWKDFGRKFGSAGHLAVVVHSDDPARNAAVVEQLASALAQRPDVNFLEYRTEAGFYRRHKLLYISLEDLREVERRVKSDFGSSGRRATRCSPTCCYPTRKVRRKVRRKARKKDTKRAKARAARR